MTKTFQDSGEGTCEDIIIENDQIQATGFMEIHAGIYTESPAVWKGTSHWTVSGTLTIENLSKKK